MYSNQGSKNNLNGSEASSWPPGSTSNKDNRDMVLFGYNLYNTALVNIKESTITSITVQNVGKTIILKTTMMRLFIFFLNRGTDRLISVDEILKEVWDNYHLSSSSQRLWQVLQSLKTKLGTLGIPDDFIVRTEAGGYRVKIEFVIPLYYQRKKVSS
ncbi:winged helix-turn-helix domain-containing protein [Dryocola clanedunensis]|uniref:winged helix-turn-helix domain-containing protein n=1 Tax=Cedecea sulfonylureivorans TaxID=3051154 RepID=UPI00192873CA|nr:helix-turn-helix domain-containing protein [Cedecea sulfonylureivorans]